MILIFQSIALLATTTYETFLEHTIVSFSKENMFFFIFNIRSILIEKIRLLMEENLIIGYSNTREEKLSIQSYMFSIVKNQVITHLEMFTLFKFTHSFEENQIYSLTDIFIENFVLICGFPQSESLSFNNLSASLLKEIISLLIMTRYAMAIILPDGPS